MPPKETITKLLSSEIREDVLLAIAYIKKKHRTYNNLRRIASLATHTYGVKWYWLNYTKMYRTIPPDHKYIIIKVEEIY